MKAAYHSSVLALLQDIASLNPDEGPVELICLWFDDLYHPCDERSEPMSLAVWERGIREWRACFTEHELNALAEFHSVFNAEQRRGLHSDWPGWDEDPGWLRVRDAARVALTKMQASPSNPG